jgi:hypothetical protein
MTGIVLGRFAVVALNGCANATPNKSADDKPTVIKLPLGVKVCAIHRVPLMTTKGLEDPTLLEAIPLFESDSKREEESRIRMQFQRLDSHAPAPKNAPNRSNSTTARLVRLQCVGRAFTMATSGIFS